jgi:DNA (cytosine-5)-methyltransferase 1
MQNEPVMLFVDLFCGAGGTTSGIEHARYFDKKIAKVIACVNHDELAIASHTENHPDCLHFTEDIRTLDLTELIIQVQIYREYYPNAKLCLWASLECTNFSKAKGGQPRDADSRTLAEHLFRYMDAIDFDYVFIENVEEFMSWGPLDKNGKPVSKTKGTDYVRWCNKVQAHGSGYKYDYRILNSADFGAHTSRKRYFGVFPKHGLPLAFPKPTHGKNAKPDSGLKPWRAVKEVLDFQDEGESIFTRKKPLSEKTLARIYAGLVKYVAKGDTSFLKKYYSGRPAGKVSSTDDPSGSLTTFGGPALVQTFLSKYFSGNPEHKNISVEGPSGAITCKDHHALVQPISLLKYNSTNGKTGVHVPPDLNQPSPVISTQGRLGLIQGRFLAHYYGNGFCTSVVEPCPTLRTKDGVTVIDYHWIDKQYSGPENHQSIDQPAGAVMPNDKHALAAASFIARDFSGGGQISSVDQPAGAVLPVPKMSLVQVKEGSWILSPHFENKGNSIDEPLPTITANRKHHCLMFPQWGLHCCHSTEKPSPTLVARMDKMCPYLIEAEETGAPIAIMVFDTDSPETVKIKEFMAAYGIVDIKMRMLRIKELKLITGFDENYVLKGTQADQKKFIGNAVPVLLAQAIIESFAGALIEPILEKDLIAA